MQTIVQYCHPRVKEIFDTRGPFRYKKSEMPTLAMSNLEKRAMSVIARGEYYLG